MFAKYKKLIALAAVASGFCHAGVVNYISEEKNSLTYFESAEAIENLHIRTISGWKGEGDRVFSIKRKQGDKTLPYICSNVFEITKIKKGIFSSDKKIHYKHQLINANKILKITPASADEKLALGLSPDESEDIGVMELSGGNNIYVLNPAKSGYVFCGVVDGKIMTSTPIKGAASFGITNDRCKLSEPEWIPILGKADEPRSFHYGDEVKATFEACQAMEEEKKKSIEKAKEQERQRRQKKIDEERARFEQQKRNHKMAAGVDILGDIGVERAKSVIAGCRWSPLVASYTEDEFRIYKCGGYYYEEIENLKREMRIRGLIDN